MAIPLLVLLTGLVFGSFISFVSFWLPRRESISSKSSYSIRYPLIAITTTALFLLIYMRYGLTLPSIILMLLGAALLIMIVVDLKHYIIPDRIQWVLLGLGIAWHVLLHTPVKIPVSGFIAGATIGLTLHYGYRWIRKKEGLGLGDVKFLAVAGVWLGVMPMVPFLFFAGVFGTIFGLLWRAMGKGHVFPFGPALAASLFLCVAFPQYPNLLWNIVDSLR